MPDPTAGARRSAPAATRNREPILAVLARFVAEDADVLEVASGTGEHATFFAERLAIASWQPTDPDSTARASIDAWTAHRSAARVRPALRLEASERPWPVERADAIVNINLIHIAPWRVCLGVLDGARDVLTPGGILYFYGPFRRGGVHTAPSNEAFDQSLRNLDPSWGVRDLEAVVAEAEQRNLRLEDVIEMPANNLSVVLRRPLP